MVEGIRRMRDRGAASSSLYVDALNPTGAARLYQRLGFGVGLELDVFEAAPG
jgi:ribosomal protein S18 acetylase RimI-like enzyme